MHTPDKEFPSQSCGDLRPQACGTERSQGAAFMRWVPMENWEPALLLRHLHCYKSPAATVMPIAVAPVACSGEATWQLLLAKGSPRAAATYSTCLAPCMVAARAPVKLPERKTGSNFQLEVSVDSGGSTGTLARSGYCASIASSTGIVCEATCSASGGFIRGRVEQTRGAGCHEALHRA